MSYAHQPRRSPSPETIRREQPRVPHDDGRIERLIDRLPESWRSGVRWMRQPSSRWARIPAGAVLVGGSALSILPVFGLWMLPAGLILLAEDIPALRRLRNRTLDWLEVRRPHWFS